MANPELGQIRDGLREINVEATEVLPKIAAVEKEMQKLLTTATGGKATPQAIQQTSTQLLAGTMPVTESLNIDGIGIDLVEFGPRIKEIVTNFQKTIIDKALFTLNNAENLIAKAGEVYPDLSGAVSKGTVKTKATATSTPETVTKADEVGFSTILNTAKVNIGELANAIAKYTVRIESLSASIPKAIYHATTREFEGLPSNVPGYFGEKRRFQGEPDGIFFATDPEQAVIDAGLVGRNARVIEAQQSARNPYIVTEENVDEYRGMYYDAARSLGWKDKDIGFEDWIATNYGMDVATSEKFSETLRGKGYDAVYNTLNENFIALDSTVIKASQALDKLTTSTTKADQALSATVSPEEYARREQALLTVPKNQLPPRVAEMFEQEAGSFRSILTGAAGPKVITYDQQGRGYRVTDNPPEWSDLYENEGLRDKKRYINALTKIVEGTDATSRPSRYLDVAKTGVLSGLTEGQYPDPEVLAYLGRGDDAARALLKRFEETTSMGEVFAPEEQIPDPRVRDWTWNRMVQIRGAEAQGVEVPPAETPVPTPEWGAELDKAAQALRGLTESAQKADQALEKVRVMEEPVTQAGGGGIGGGGGKPPVVATDFPEDDDYKRIRETIRKRFAAIFEQLSPEQIDKMVQATLEGQTRVSAGTVEGKRFRPRLVEVAREAGIIPETAAEVKRFSEKPKATESFEDITEAYEYALGGDMDFQRQVENMFRAKEILDKKVAEDFNNIAEDYEYAASRVSEEEILRAPVGPERPTPEPEEVTVKKGYTPTKFFDEELVTRGIKPGAINDIKRIINETGAAFEALDVKVKTVDRSTSKLAVTLLNQAGVALRQVPILVKGATASLDGLRKSAQTPLDIPALQYQEKLKNAFAIAAEQGFAPEDLKKVTRFDTRAGYERMLFSKIDEEGVTQQLPLIVDKAGKAIVSTQKQFRTAVDAIVRDFKEVLRWSIAVAAIYAPMRKFSEAIQLAIENESKLADIAIVLNKSHKEIGEVFDAAATAARAMGEDIGGVLQSYELAYKAAGRAANETERVAIANDLLTATLVLSKLSSLDQAQSLDILGGTLQQVGKSLDDTVNPLRSGMLLLDKWVAVAKTANVDLGTLATAFSITAESAENAGLDIDKLNGVVGALSEKIGALGAAQTGNAVRALIGGVYAPGAESELGRFGISVKDSSDQMRSWLDIMTEIHDLNKAGLISDDQLNKIALTLGQGVRRGQQYLSVLDDIDRVRELSIVSAEAQGDAEAALATKMETVQTATTNMGTAFQQMAQSMGTEGGVLTLMRQMIEAATYLTDTLTKLFDTVGKAAPSFTAATAAMLLFFRSKGSYDTFRQNLTVRTADILGAGTTRQEMSFPGGMIFGGGISRWWQGSGTNQDPGMGNRVAGAIGRYGPGFMMGVPGAVAHLGEGETTEAGVAMGAAILGTLMAGGNPLGGLIGTVVAETFIQGIKNAKGDIRDVLESPYKEPVADARGVSKSREDFRKITEEEKLMKQLESMAFPGGVRWPVQFEAWINQLLKPGQFEEGKQSTDISLALREAETFVAKYEGGDVGKRDISIGGRIFSAKDAEEAYEFAQGLLEVAEKLVSITPIELVDVDVTKSSIETARNALIKDYLPTIEKVQEGLRETGREDLFTGKIKPKQFSDVSDIISGMKASLSKLYVVAFDEEGQTPEEITKNLELLGKMLTEISSEEYNILFRGVDEVREMTAALEQAEGGFVKWRVGVELETFSLDEFEKLLEAEEQKVQSTLTALTRETMKRNLVIPTIVGAEDISTETEFDAVSKRAEKIQKEFYDRGMELELPGFTPEAIEALIKDAEPFLVKVGGQMNYLIAKGLTDSKWFTEAFNEMMEEGLITSQKLGYQFLDFTQAEVQGVMPEYESLKRRIEEAGGTVEEQEQLNIYKDGIIEPMRKDWKLVQYLLQQIADNTKKQLDGMYNFPEGASFWIPLSAAQMYSQRGGGAGGGGGGTGGTETEEEITRTTALRTDTATRVERDALRPTRKMPEVEAYRTYIPLAKEEEIPQWQRFQREWDMSPTPTDEDVTWIDRINSGVDTFITGVNSFAGNLNWESITESMNSLPGIVENFRSSVKTSTLNFFDMLGDIFGFEVGPKKNTGLPPIGDTNIGTTTIPLNTANVDTNAAIGLRLSIESRTQLVVDGRTLANVVKQYVRNDLIRSSGTASSLNLNAVI